MTNRFNRRRLLWLGGATALAASRRALGAAGTLVANPTELLAAVRAAAPGDSIILKDGVWRDADLTLEARGGENAWITIRPETPGQVILTGRSRLRFSGYHFAVENLVFRECSYPGDIIQFRVSSTNLARECRLSDCAIVDCNPEALDLDTKWVSLYGFQNEVCRCYLAGKRNPGATLVVWLPAATTPPDPNYHRIGENWFGPRPVLGVNGGETIRVGDSATSMRDSRTIVENNFFDACNGEIECISNKSCENEYLANHFSACEATLTLRHGDRCRVDGNFFLGRGRPNTGGVRIIGEDHTVVNNYFEGLTGTSFRAAISAVNGLPDTPLNGYFQVKRPLIAHNTIVDCREPLAIGVNGGDSRLVLPPQDVVTGNNIIAAAELLTAQHGYWRNDEGVLRPSPHLSLRIPATSGFTQVLTDIDGQPRTWPPASGCDEVSAEPRTRWLWDHTTAGPRWWPR